MTIMISIVGLIIAVLIAVLTNERYMFWTAGILIGLFSGPNQAASRSLMARFVPENKENEFFGFFAFSGKATSFMGPLLLGIITSFTNSQRFGVASFLLFLVAGGLILLKVNEKTGIKSSISE